MDDFNDEYYFKLSEEERWELAAKDVDNILKKYSDDKEFLSLLIKTLNGLIASHEEDDMFEKADYANKIKNTIINKTNGMFLP